MSGVEVLTDSPLWHAHDHDELVHVHCCFDPSKALCGLPCDELAGADEPTTCSRCDELELRYPEYCPAGFVCEVAS